MRCLNAPSGAGCFLPARRRKGCSPATRVLMHLLVLGAFCLSGRSFLCGSCSRLNAPSGAGCFLPIDDVVIAFEAVGLNAPSGAGCFLPPASGSGVVAPLPRAGAPPAPQAPYGTGQQRPYLTIFRRPDAKRHRRPFGSLQLPTSDDVKPKGRRSRL